MKSNKLKKEKTILILLFIIGILLRTYYIQETKYYQRQHDLGTLEKNGCLNYIYTIYETGKLPKTNTNQFYHPPLHHIISATFLKVVSPLAQNQTDLFEYLQLLPYLYSILLMFIIYRITKELKLNSLIKILIITIVSLHPTYIILSGSINNDMLSILLIHLTILQTIRWYKNNNLKNTIILALTTGTSVMAKTSGAIMAPAISIIFIWKLVNDIIANKQKTKIIKKYIITFSIFGIISLSIGLWYPIRNYILFDQPILYVLDPLDKAQYYGDIKFIDRIIPSLQSTFSIYHNSYKDASNIYSSAIKTSMFGEYVFAENGIIHTLSLISVVTNFYLGLIIPIIIIINLIKNIKNKDQELKWKIFLIIIFIINIISFIIMQIKLPYGCSSDFRYIVPTIITSITLLGYTYKNTKKPIKNNILKLSIFILIILSIIFADISIFINI